MMQLLVNLTTKLSTNINLKNKILDGSVMISKKKLHDGVKYTFIALLLLLKLY